MESLEQIPAEGIRQRLTAIENELVDALRETVRSGEYLQGTQVKRLEAEICNRWSCGVAIAVNSGTAALQLAMVASGLGPGDEVIVPAISFVSTAFAVNAVGAVPVFVDVDPHTLTLSANSVEDAITRRTAAIVPVHLYGQMADMAPLVKLAQRHGLKLIEDCAQAHGAQYDGQYAGTIGDFGCFSFYAGKNVGGVEDAGMIIAGQHADRDQLMMLRDLGRLPGERYRHLCWGMRARMGEFTARVIQLELTRLDEWVLMRRNIARYYKECLSDIALDLPYPALRREHVYYKYPVIARSPKCRDALEIALTAAGVQTERIYPMLLPDQPAYRSGQLSSRKLDLPVASDAVTRLTCLPIYPELSIGSVQRIVHAVRQSSLSM